MARTDSRHYDLEKLPAYSIPIINRTRASLRKMFVEELEVAGRPLAGTLLEEAGAYIVHKRLTRPEDYKNPANPWEEEYLELQEDIRTLEESRYRSVMQILSLYTDSALDAGTLSRVCAHLAGWFAEMREGLAWKSWDGYRPVWAPVYFRSCERIVHPGGKRYKAVMTSMSGPTVTSHWEMTLTPARAQTIMREIGLPKWEEYPVEDLGGLYGTTLVSVRGRHVSFGEWHVSTSQRSLNKKIYAARQQPCAGPYTPMNGRKCAPCPVSRGACPLSRIMQGYDIVRSCVREHEGYFRNLTDEFCFACLLSGRARKDEYDKR